MASPRQQLPSSRGKETIRPPDGRANGILSPARLGPGSRQERGDKAPGRGGIAEPIAGGRRILRQLLSNSHPTIFVTPMAPPRTSGLKGPDTPEKLEQFDLPLTVNGLPEREEVNANWHSGFGVDDRQRQADKDHGPEARQRQRLERMTVGERRGWRAA